MTSSVEKPSTLIFLHIPKTAGITLYQVLERQYKAAEIRNIFGLMEYRHFEALTLDERDAFRLLRGHFEYGLHKLLPRDATYFTVLREPVARKISYYNYLHQRPLDPMHKLIKAENLSLQQFIERGVDPLADNAQTRLLSGTWYDVPVGECDEQVLAKACENLQKMAVVGLTERFDETLLLLQAAFGWRWINYFSRNITRKRTGMADVPAAALDAVRRSNELDLKLYQFAQTIFAEQISRLGEEEFNRKLSRFRQNNRSMEPLVRLHWKIRQVSVRTMVRNLLSR